MIGIDISYWQTGIELSRYTQYIDFVIMKASEGINYEDPMFKTFSAQAKELGLLMGCYHFAHPDVNKTAREMIEEADWFIETVKRRGLLGKAILVIDWEVGPTDNAELLLTLLSRVENKTGIMPFVYANESTLKTKNFDPITTIYPIWMAKWPTKNQQPIETAKVWVENAMKSIADSWYWFIWQFSSTGKLPNFSSNVDLNYCKLSPATWGQMCKSADEIISDDMQWAIDVGLYEGYDDGRYHPKDPLTREQAASVIRRYDQSLCKRLGITK